MNYIPPKKSEVEAGTENALCLESYSTQERLMLERLEALFKDWYAEFKTAEGPSGKIIRDFSAEDMCFDGFYPGYLDQRVKILFLGRESREISGFNYLELLYQAIKEGRIGSKSLNRSEFHRRMLYIAYCLQTGESAYSEVPWAQELSPAFGTSKLSFAFMNLSKFSNENASYQSDYELIRKAVELSTRHRNFIQEEIVLLRPDVIFAMRLSDFFDSIGPLEPIAAEAYKSSPVRPYTLTAGNQQFLLLDTPHFSAIVPEEKAFFKPILDVLMDDRLRAFTPFLDRH